MPFIRINGKKQWVAPRANAHVPRSTYYKVSDGFLMGNWHQHGTPLNLTARQAKYLLMHNKISAAPVAEPEKPAFKQVTPVRARNAQRLMTPAEERQHISNMMRHGSLSTRFGAIKVQG